MGTLRRRLRAMAIAAPRLLHSDRPALLIVVKSTFAAAAAFELARHTIGSAIPALAAMAAIITVQVSGSQTVRRALEYSAGVAAGVIAAIALTRLLGVHWWSIGLLVFLALIAGRLIRLGSQANQVAISALLVMSLGSSYGWTRVSDALIGSAVGVVTSLVTPSPSPERRLRGQIGSAADELVVVIRRMADGLRAGWSPAEARDTLGSARSVSRLLVDPRTFVERARDEHRVSLAGRWQVEPRGLDRCDAALTALDHVTNEVRSVGRNLLAISVDNTAHRGRDRSAFGDVLEAVADTLDAWRIAAIADGAGPQLDRLGLTSDRAAAKLLSLKHEGRPDQLEPLWVALLIDVERLIGELDPAGAHGAAVTASSAPSVLTDPGTRAEADPAAHAREG
ncbi:MAG TPA: FUSC family protein [Mycobacteriales bacterium]|nr:FUSC family protein [Mycobacteriales bacterium]